MKTIYTNVIFFHILVYPRVPAGKLTIADIAKEITIFNNVAMEISRFNRHIIFI